MDIEELFDKVYKFVIPDKKDGGWSLAPLIDGSVKHSSDIIKQLKKDLNDQKRLLNDYDLTKWNKHTQETNLAGRVISHIRHSVHPELCTQAWCKFHEILCFDHILPDSAISAKLVNAIHICEAPGAFICSLNHYLKSHYKKVKYQWLGCTLNPYYEGHNPNFCIADDRLIFHTLPKWCFGSDNTGDVFASSTLEELVQKTSKWNSVDLVTADGSINCQLDPEKQELDTASLKYTELLYALKLLSAGGSFILKIFTMFELVSIVLVYVLCCTFSSVSVRKPATSKPGNSEAYIVAKGFHGRDHCREFIDTLMARFPFKQPEDLETISSIQIPHEYFSQHEACIARFVQLQIGAIRRNINLNETSLGPEFEAVKNSVADHAIDIMQLRKIQMNQCVLKSGILRRNPRSNVKLRPKLEGTFSGRKISHKPSSDNREECGVGSFYMKCLDPVQETGTNLDNHDFILGKPISSIGTSLFCDTGKLMMLLEIWSSRIDKTDLSGSINPKLPKFLSDLIFCNCVKAYELDVGSQSLSWRQIFRDIFPDLPALQFETVMFKSSWDVKSGCAGQRFLDCVLFVNLVPRDDLTGGFRELLVGENFLNVAGYVVASLSPGSSLILLLPSVLTRLTAGLLWLLRRDFDNCALCTTGSRDIPGLFFVCKGFRKNARFEERLRRCASSKKECDANRWMLEIVPVDVLVNDRELTAGLRMCNHEIIDLRTMQQHSFVL